MRCQKDLQADRDLAGHPVTCVVVVLCYVSCYNYSILQLMYVDIWHRLVKKHALDLLDELDRLGQQQSLPEGMEVMIYVDTLLPALCVSLP